MKRMLSPVVVYSAFVAIMLVAFRATAFAAGVAAGDPDSPLSIQDILDLLRPVWDAFRGGHSVAAGALAVVALVAVAKRYGGKLPTVRGVDLGAKLEAFLHTDVGGTVATFLTATAGAVAAADSLAPSVLWTAGGIGAAAIGGYVMLRRLVIDPIKASAWYQDKAPSWVKVALGLLFWIADKPDAVAAAEKAGDDAVKANPSKGADGVAGPAEKF